MASPHVPSNVISRGSRHKQTEVLHKHNKCKILQKNLAERKELQRDDDKFLTLKIQHLGKTAH